MSAAEQLDLPPMTFEDHLEHDIRTGIRHEIRDGVLVAMAGGTPEHGDAGTNVLRELSNEHVAGNPCKPSGSDQMVYQPDPGRGVYPDVSVVCGKRDFCEWTKHGKNVIANPTLVVEVLSESTAQWDQTTKFERYQSIPTLREYVLIDPTTPWVRQFVRDGEEWRMRTRTELDAAVEFESVGVTVPMKTIYFDVPTGAVSTVRVQEEPEEA